MKLFRVAIMPRTGPRSPPSGGTGTASFRLVMAFRGSVELPDDPAPVQVAAAHLFLWGESGPVRHVGTALTPHTEGTPDLSRLVSVYSALERYFSLEDGPFCPTLCADPCQQSDREVLREWSEAHGDKGAVRDCAKSDFDRLLVHAPPLAEVPIGRRMSVIGPMAREAWSDCMETASLRHVSVFGGHPVLFNPSGAENACLLDSFLLHPSTPFYGLSRGDLRRKLVDVMLHWLRESPVEICAIAGHALVPCCGVEVTSQELELVPEEKMLKHINGCVASSGRGGQTARLP